VGQDMFPHMDNIYGPDHIIVGGAHPSRKEVKANARLIAAAPELLAEARKAMLAINTWLNFDGSEGDVEQAAVDLEMAIAKAEGR